MSFCKSSGFRLIAIAGCLAASVAIIHAQPQLRRLNRAAVFEPPSAPVPADPLELVTSGIQLASTPAHRLAALQRNTDRAHHRAFVEAFSNERNHEASSALDQAQCIMGAFAHIFSSFLVILAHWQKPCLFVFKEP